MNVIRELVQLEAQLDEVLFARGDMATKFIKARGIAGSDPVPKAMKAILGRDIQGFKKAVGPDVRESIMRNGLPSTRREWRTTMKEIAPALAGGRLSVMNATRGAAADMLKEIRSGKPPMKKVMRKLDKVLKERGFGPGRGWPPPLVQLATEIPDVTELETHPSKRRRVAQAAGIAGAAGVTVGGGSLLYHGVQDARKDAASQAKRDVFGRAAQSRGRGPIIHVHPDGTAVRGIPSTWNTKPPGWLQKRVTAQTARSQHKATISALKKPLQTISGALTRRLGPRG